MRAQLFSAVRAVVLFTLLLGIGYPLVVTGIAQVGFKDKADGSLIEVDGTPAGSRLLGQPFEGEQWFHPRPSAASEPYGAMSSGGSNLGPTNEVLIDTVRERVQTYREINGLAVEDDVPVDAVTASGSGLDPHISVANARLQAPRVARARSLDLARVMELIDQSTQDPVLGFLGEPAVNVVELNLSLESLG